MRASFGGRDVGRALIAGTLAAAALSAAACNGAEGTRPHDMGTAGHEAAARAEEAEAAEHDALYAASVTRAERCGRADADRGGFCWTTDISPTEEHRAEAERHRRIAAEHRAASAALRQAEERACGGIDEIDRDMSPFAHREDIVAVRELTVAVPVGRQTLSRIVGATVVFRATPGMTAEWLQRIVDCHLARNAALGHDVPEMPYCPLVLPRVTARVRSARGGFAIDVRADDRETADEVLRRARALVQPPPAHASARPR